MPDNLDHLVRVLGQTHRVFWHGNATDAAIGRLGHLLGVSLPESFKQFLRDYGGGGKVGQEISGIEDQDPSIDNKGTVYGDTLHCRDEFGLPAQYVVVYFSDDETVWCLDTSSTAGGECPVVSFDVANKKVHLLFPNFVMFFEDYLKRRAG